MSRTDTTTERPTMSARTVCARATALTLALGATGALATALAIPASAGFDCPRPPAVDRRHGDRTGAGAHHQSVA